MNILITNDDGVHAPGIKALRKGICGDSYSKVVTVAPSLQQSTTGHSLSLDRPVRLEEVDENVWGCTGFPADCVHVAFGHVFEDSKPDCVLSGINKGANLAQDLYYSGTLAAAREACFQGVPSVGVSLVSDYKSDTFHFGAAAEMTARFVGERLFEVLGKYSMLSLNVPNRPQSEIKGFRLAHLGERYYSESVERRTDSRGREYFWIGGHFNGHNSFDGKSDCEVVEAGYVSVTAHQVLPHGEFDAEKLENGINKLNQKFF